MKDNKRNIHLEKLQTFIEERSRFHELNFDLLYDKLNEEIDKEVERLNDPKLNYYLNNLQQTRDKQALSFLNSKIDDKQQAYMDFIDAFQHDIKDELGRIRNH